MAFIQWNNGAIPIFVSCFALSSMVTIVVLDGIPERTSFCMGTLLQWLERAEHWPESQFGSTETQMDSEGPKRDRFEQKTVFLGSKRP